MLQRKVEKRIDQYLAMLEQYAYEEVADLTFSYAESVEMQTEGVYEGEYASVTFPFAYGKPWTDHWFKASIEVPKYEQRFFLLLDTETDTLIYIDGVPVGATNPFHRKLEVTAYAGRNITVVLQAWGGHRFPGYHPSEGGRVQTCVAVKKQAYPLVFKQPKLLRRCEQTYALYYDVLVLRQLSKTLDPTEYHYQHLVSTLHQALSSLSLLASPEPQAREVREQLKGLLEAKNGSIAPQILSVGNAHLDHAWLWPIAETTRKAARTALNMVNFLQEYPDFVFLFSQPAQMEALKKEYPSVFSRIKEVYSKTGRWEPNGVCYVEPDCMLPSGESLIRQNILGRQTTRQLFDGYEADTFWLPDSFGYTAALPQILVGCRVQYFVTSKLSWNDTNRFPYDIFLWESLDGTQIPAHMIQGAYEGTNDPEGLAKAYQSVLHKEIQPELMRSVGEGDGGGGTLRSDLELAKREADLQGLPRNRWSSVSSAMQQIFADTSRLPVYKGELYLELHRGTYTSQAKLKWWNRRLEGLLHGYEYLTSVLFSRGDDVQALRASLSEAWKAVLVNQFHDILPGSSIQKVNEEALASYEKAFALLEKAFAPYQGDYLLNTNGFVLPLGDGTALAAFEAGKQSKSKPSQTVAPSSQVRTEWATLALDGMGGITSLLLGEGERELVEEGRALNTLTIGEDYPVFWDAWDIESDSLEKQTRLKSLRETERVEDEQRLFITYQAQIGLHSSLKQMMTIHKKYRRIDFVTEVDWKERHTLLRAEFPTSIRCDQALFDVPFGYIRRETHTNTSLERAKFEVPAHKFAALEDRSILFALASDSKYGYGAHAGELSISLLRSPSAPDGEADLGVHTFTYSLIVGDDLGCVYEQASGLNNPPLAVKERFEPLVKVAEKQFAVETVKISEDGQDLVIRIREWLGIGGKATLSFCPHLDAHSLKLANMLEEVIAQEKKCLFRPFEVQTYRIKVRTLSQ
jgi:alpha-mannosidase